MLDEDETIRSNSPAQRFVALVKRQPRRAAVLMGLTTLLAVLVVRSVIGDRAAPSSAQAAPPVTPTELPQPDSATAASAAPRQPKSLAEWAGQQNSQIQRNLFAIPFDAYPVDPNHPAPSSQPSGKSGPSDADQNKERQILAETVRTEAAKLTLEGIVLGASPKVWVNGSLIGVGQTIGSSGLKVVKIEAHRVLVECNGITVELKMK